MTIDPAWLREAIELIAGQNTCDDEALALAGVLGEADEVLPWLVLRQHALADEPAIMDALVVQARQMGQARPMGQATGADTPGFAVSAHVVELDRALNDALALIVAEDVACAALAEEVQGLFVRRHAVAPCDPGATHLAYRDRIGEPVDR